MNRARSGCAGTAALIVFMLAGCGGDGPEGVPRVDTGGGATQPMANGGGITTGVGQTPGAGTTTTLDAGVSGVAGAPGASGAQDASVTTDTVNTANSASNPDDDDFIGIDEIDDFANFNDLEDFSDLDEFGRFVFGPSGGAAGSGSLTRNNTNRNR